MKEEKIKSLAEEVINLAKNVSAVNLRFMNTAISLLKTEQYEGDSFCTNGETFFYNPLYILKAYKTGKEYPPRYYLHSLLHCVFRHWYVSTLLNTDLWDLSCDIAVEAIINELDIPSLTIKQNNAQQTVINQLKSEIKFVTAEKVYNYYLEKLTDSEIEKLKRLFSPDDHTLWYIREGENDDGDGDGNGDRKESRLSQYAKELSDAWQKISEQMQTDLETFSKLKGDKAGTLVQNLTAVNREKYDYSEFLKKFSVMGEAMKVNEDEFDYIFYTYGMKLYDKMPLIEPLEYKDVKRIKEFVIVIDTSGSVQGELVQKFVQKTYNILKNEESFFSKINLHIIQCDADIQEDVKITCQEDFDNYLSTMKLHGFGGTDFRPAFSYVDELIKAGEFTNLKGLIYFTDGFGDFPARKPDYNTAFVFIDDEYNNPDIPVWAIKLVLQKNEI